VDVEEGVEMSEHTTKTDKPVSIPHEQRTQATLDTLDELEHSVSFVRFELKKLNTELTAITNRINKLRLVLEAK
jgi:uncharacterized coiled-coil protein SlyX